MLLEITMRIFSLSNTAEHFTNHSSQNITIKTYKNLQTNSIDASFYCAGTYYLG